MPHLRLSLDLKKDNSEDPYSSVCYVEAALSEEDMQRSHEEFVKVVLRPMYEYVERGAYLKSEPPPE